MAKQRKSAIQFQGGGKPDLHGHVCEHCGCVFTHDKGKIAVGSGHHAHKCSSCGKPVNTRVEMDELSDLARPVDTYDWYGPGGLAAKVMNVDLAGVK